jgi:HlyD family secretion protein
VRFAHGLGIARLAVVAAVLVGCAAPGGGVVPGGQTNPVARPAVTVNVVKAAVGAISQNIGYSGSVQAADNVNVVPTISGRITKLTVDVGSTVKAGDLIAELDKSTLNAQISQAVAGLAAANVKLDQVKAGARPETIAAAQANAQGAQAKLDAAKAGGRPEAIGVAQANLSSAQAKLAAIRAGARPENVAVAKANLDTAQSKLQQALDLESPTPDQVATVRLQLEQSKDSLTAAQATKDGQCGGRNPAFQCEAAQASAMAAETSVNVAAQNLKTLTDPPTQATQDAVTQAKVAVVAAQQQYNLAQAPYTATDIAQAQAAVDAAQQQYNLAVTPNSPTDVAQAQAAADAAASQAALAAQPYTDLDVRAAQAAVDQAQAALDIVKSQLAQADVAAPFDGIITAKLLSVGALASSATPIVSMMSPNLQVQFSIDEGQVSSVKAGQTVSLTTSAFPGKQFPATVASVNPAADPKTHTFAVVVQPQDTSGSLHAGMFVTLNVTVASVPNALLVPSVAIVQNGPQSIVYVDNNGTAHAAPITAGIADDTNTQIISGINPGDQIITSNQANLADGTSVRIAGPTTGSGGGQAAPQAGNGSPTTGGQRSGNGTPTTGAQRQGARPTATATPAG